MSRYEITWPCCGDTTVTDAWEPSECPFCNSAERQRALSAPPPAGAQQAVAARIAGEAAAFRWLIANRITEDENGWLQLHYSTARQGKDHPDKQWVAKDIAWEAGVYLDAVAAPAAANSGGKE